MRKYRVSRFRELIFPKELIIDKYHVLSRKRHFPAFWRVNEESIPLSKLASIQIHRGLLFSKIIIENAGGPYPIIVNGLWNPKAREARDLLELIEREIAKAQDVSFLVGDEEDEPTRGTGGAGPPGGYHGSSGGGEDHRVPSPPTPPASPSTPENERRNPSAAYDTSPQLDFAPKTPEPDPPKPEPPNPQKT